MPSAFRFILPLMVVLAVHPSHTAAAGPAALLRFPDVHGDTVAFVYGDDIWSAPVAGGTATRLTFHDGEERFPQFSPDGRHIAFTGDYDGNTDVYVMNADGGDIRRVTYHPDDDEVLGWHPTNGQILFRSGRLSYSRFTRLFLINPDGTACAPLILNEAAIGSFAPDASRIAFNKVSRENRTWKRYRGGTAQDIYIYDFESGAVRRMTDFGGTDRIPMWIGNQIVFASDRGRRLNLYTLDPDTGATAALTEHTDDDVRRPSAGDGDRVVYELGGTLWLLELATRTTRPLAITVPHDAEEARPRWQDVHDAITQVRCSPTGKRAVVGARGEIFTVPAEHGPTRNLTRSSASREKDAAWSPDGRWIAMLSDRGGETDIWLQDPMATEPPRQLTFSTSGYRHTLRWSPDSRLIAFADQTLRCHIVDVASGTVTAVDRATHENVDVGLDRKPIHDFQWSPDSRYLTYSKMNADLLYQVHVYEVASGEIHAASDGRFNDFQPVFTRDGRHLVFISNRRFDPTYCDFEWEMVYKNAAGLYALTLAADGGALLPPRSDEEPAAADTPDAESKNGPAPDAAPQTRIDFDRLAQRIEALPVPRGNYRDLAATDDGILFLNGTDGDYNRFEYRSLGARPLQVFTFEDRKVHTLLAAVDAYDLAADGTHIATRKGATIGLIEASARDATHTPLDVSDVRMWLEPRREWAQIFHEAWRMERDFYYDPGMHGLDWAALRDHYGRRLPSLSCRQDLGFLIGELIGELNTSHTYVFGGDRARHADRVGVGMLGTDWVADDTVGRYRFGRIYRTADWTQEVIPPLARPGVDIAEGDVLLAIDDQPVTTARNIYSYFQGRAGSQMRLRVNSQPTDAGARTVVVEAIGSERTLRYVDWTEQNRLAVAKASDGRIGYLHFPDTYLGSAREFPRFFYGQTRKQGLIVDGRYNGGGLDPDIFLQRLDKKLLTFWTRRYSHDQTTPFVVTQAHLACLTNRQAGSGGDMLPMEFQMRGMGPVIGTRTWGGLVGVSMFIDLIDGGGLTAPDYRIYDREGRWIVENTGVTPDIEVELDPQEMASGHDAQLHKAVEVLLEAMARDPRPWPKHDPFPVDR